MVEEDAATKTARNDAFEKAVVRFGDRAVVGYGRPIGTWNGEDVYYVGWKEVGEWRWLGVGASWDDAFAAVKKVKSHFRDKLEFYA